MSEETTDSPHRRQFIQMFGVALASAALGGSLPFGRAWAQDGTGDGTGSSSGELHPAFARIREAWLDLAQITDPAAQDWTWDQGETFLETRRDAHRRALDTLVADGLASAEVADQMQNAYYQASEHLWMSNSGTDCYEEPGEMEYLRIDGRSDLAAQLALLIEMRERGVIDEATLATSRAAIERDITLFDALRHLPSLANWEAELAAARELRDRVYGLDSEVTPEALEAARLLIEILSTGMTQ